MLQRQQISTLSATTEIAALRVGANIRLGISVRLVISDGSLFPLRTANPIRIGVSYCVSN